MARGPRPAASALPNARYAHLDVPGPMPLDMVRAVPAIRRDPLAFLASLVARYGDLVAFPMPRGTVLLVNDPAAVRRVLLENHRGWTKATLQYSSLAAVTGEGLLTSDGEAWRTHRPVVQPAFQHGALATVADVAISSAARLRARWDGAPGRLLDADAAVMAAMLEVVGRTLVGTDLGPMAERIVSAVDRALRLVVGRAASPVPTTWPTPPRHRLRRAVAVLDDLAADVVRGRRDAGTCGPDDDVLGLLLRAADAGLLTEREVRDEIVTLVVAGHETVASSLVWMLKLLAENPAVADAVRAEVDAVVGDRGAPAWGDLPALRLTRAVVDESLRLYPPAWVITRRAAADDELCGVPVPAGTLVIVSPWLLHRRPDAWPDPERFAPDRFLRQPRASLPRPDYLPFGLGFRLCIGRDTALVEAVLVLATVLRGRRVRRPDGAPPVRVDALVTLRPHGGLPLHLDRVR